MRHSPEDYDDLAAVPNPDGWTRQDRRDLYSAFGWLGTGAIGVMLGFHVLLISPPQWWTPAYATAYFVVAGMPWIGAFGTMAYLRRRHAHGRRRHADVFRRGH